MSIIQNQTASGYAEKLAYHGHEVDQILGISPITRWRLEKRGLLTPVAGIKHKLYSRRAVEAFLDGRSGKAVG